MEWKEIAFDAWCGDRAWKVELSHPQGGADGYFIMINNYYHGMLFKRNGEWEGHLNGKSGITGDEIMILGDMIDGWEEK